MAQGAKPGEGGQLPGHKVDRDHRQACAIRRPASALISPPPHHDIYSIEDLAQLIFDLKCVNPEALRCRSNWSPRSASAPCDRRGQGATPIDVLISGHDGGTGAIAADVHQARRHAVGNRPGRNAPDLGAQRSAQSYRRAGRRQHEDRPRRRHRCAAGCERVRLRHLGRWSPLGCLLMRKCHLNTCPVGIATQDPVLRAKFAGQARVRHPLLLLRRRRGTRVMAALGLRKIDEMIGQSTADTGPRHRALEGEGPRFFEIFYKPRMPSRSACIARRPITASRRSLDNKLIALCEPALKSKKPVKRRAADRQRRSHRRHHAVGSRIAATAHAGLPDDTIG